MLQNDEYGGMSCMDIHRYSILHKIQLILHLQLLYDVKFNINVSTTLDIKINGII